MNTRTYTGIYLLALAAGVLLIAVSGNPDLFRYIVIAAGILLIIPSLWTLLKHYSRRKDDSLSTKAHRAAGWLMVIVGLIGIVFGVLFLAMIDFWTSFVIYVFAVVLIVCGITQIAFINSMRRSRDVGFRYFVVPVLTLIAGVVILCLGAGAVKSTLALVTGIVLVVYSLNGFWSSLARKLDTEKKEIGEDIHEEIEKDSQKSGLPLSGERKEESPGNEEQHTS